MSFKIIIGWLIFFTGISIIVLTLYYSYNIFTGKIAYPQIFKMEIKGPSDETTLTGVEKLINEQLKKLLPLDTLPKLLNLIAWSILAGILIFGGNQISSLGIKLIKN